jgi:hypothetical protein
MTIHIDDIHIDDILEQITRRALVTVVRSRAHLTLDELSQCFRGRHGKTLRTITVGELLFSETGTIEISDEPKISQWSLEKAKGLQGQAFDECVLVAIRGAEGQPVSASYLRARVGGPRWKLQASLGRLVGAGKVLRDGVTSSTRYTSKTG